MQTSPTTIDAMRVPKHRLIFGQVRDGRGDIVFSVFSNLIGIRVTESACKEKMPVLTSWCLKVNTLVFKQVTILIIAQLNKPAKRVVRPFPIGEESSGIGP